ncbi:spindle pole body component 110-like, partial [Apis laboriosa]|uniref:spindle pole body component 110-like n=1 Tax=Apis laboriosa TaxID=183418 RepID=UPI001CC59F1C
MNEYLDNCHSIEQTGDDVFKDKTRIAEVAAATLCRLNSIMKQMKDWRDDRMKLRSNIWRLKLALRVAGRETDGSVHADPLIEQQKEEIKRLETTNRELKKEIANIKSSLLSKGYVTQETDWKSEDKLVEVEQEYLMERERLNNEIQYLKSRLNEVEEGHVHSSEVEHLKCKLKHFMMVDYTMEIIFTDIVNKVAETIANLSEELVNVNERLHKSQMRNDNLYVEIDKLKAMLRFKNGNLMDYQRRIVELDNVTKRLKTEVNKFKVNYDESSWSIGSSNLKNVERFVNDLKYKLRNDHEALLGGGDPYCFMYIQKIIELRINLRQLHIDLAKSIGKEHRSTSGKLMEHNEYMKQLSKLDSILKEINNEIDKLKSNHKLQNLQGDKEELLNEMQKIRDALNKKNEETKIVLAEKNTMERVFNVKIADLSKNLQISSKENEKLQNKVNELERMKYRREASNVEKENESARRLKDITEKMNNEIQLLKVNLKISKEDFNQANREIADLKIKLEHLSDEKTKLESSVAQLESKKEILVYQLAAEKTTAEERLKEITKLKSDYVELDVEKVNLKMEKEQLNVNFTNLKVEKEQIEKSLELVQSKCSMFESKIDKYKCERNNLLEEVRNLKVTKETLTIKLEETKSQLDGTGDKIRQLDVENSKLHIDLNELTVKKTSLEQAFETREQTLLSENHDLATRVNKLDEENQTLKNQLKESKTTNEYSNVELSKLRTEYDNVKLENTTQLDELKQCNEMLKEMNNELKMKLNEIHSEYRILENQLKILELMNTTLKKEKELLEKEYTNTLQKLKMERLEKEGITSGSESVSTEQNEDMGKFEKRLKKEKVPEKESQNYEIKTQLTQTKEEIQRQKSNAVEKKTNETTIKPISNKLEIVNLYYKEINSYSSRGLKNTEAVTHIDQSSLCLYEGMNRGSDLEIEKLLEIMNKLKVENIALRMEVNSLRCNLIINFSEEEKKKKDLRIATDEIQALKSELKKLRDERESLRIKFNTTNAKLDLLESEKAALKNELYTIRNINSDFKQKISDLNSTYQKSKEKNLVFENCIVKAIKKIEKYTLCDNMQIK